MIFYHRLAIIESCSGSRGMFILCVATSRAGVQGVCLYSVWELVVQGFKWYVYIVRCSCVGSFQNVWKKSDSVIINEDDWKFPECLGKE